MGIDEYAPDVDIEAELAKEPVDAPEPVEVPEPEPTPAPVVEAKAEDKPNPAAVAPPGYVPSQALAEARRQAKERQEHQDREYNEKLARLEKRLEILANPPPPVPKFEDDPAAHLRHQQDELRKEIAPVKAELEQSRQAQAQQAAEMRLQQAVQAAESEFAASTPDYQDAINHMHAVADRNLQLLGVDDPAQRAQAIRRDAMALAVRALQAGKSPAELAYQVAKNQGYTAKSAASAVDRIANIEKGQKASPSMPTGGTKAATEVTGIEQLAQMDDDEFNKLIDDPAAWKKLIRQSA
jgi:hypothetical protein